MSESPQPLTVGFAVERPLRAWAARAVTLAAASPHADRTALVLVDAPARTAGRRTSLGGWAFAAHARLDRLLSRLSPDAFAPVSPAELAGVPVVEVTLDELPDTVRRLELNVLANMTRLPLESVQPAGEPQHEVWELRHGGVPAAAPHALFRDFAAGSATCVSALVRRGAFEEEVLYASTSLVRRLSLQRTRNAVYWKSSTFVARALQLLALRAEQPGSDDAGAVAAADARPPRLGEVALLQATLVRRALAFLRERLLHTWSWSIVWQARERPATTAVDFSPEGTLEPPPDRVYADPFLIAGEDCHYLFYEDYAAPARRATIAVARITDGKVSPGQPVIRAPYHLSYPFVFRWDGDFYMLPESGEARVVQLFRAGRFPYEWEHEATLLSGVPAYDSTLIRHDEQWFMFAAIAVEGADIDELHVFWSDSLWGPYLPHPLNPVVSDARRARPAGRIFFDDGRLLRPGQDGSSGYGSALSLSEIELLTPTSYRERPLGRIEPGWAARASGTHTIDHVGGLQVMDVKHLRPRWRLRPGPAPL